MIGFSTTPAIVQASHLVIPADSVESIEGSSFDVAQAAANDRALQVKVMSTPPSEEDPEAEGSPFGLAYGITIRDADGKGWLVCSGLVVFDFTIYEVEGEDDPKTEVSLQDALQYIVPTLTAQIDQSLRVSQILPLGPWPAGISLDPDVQAAQDGAD